MTFNKKLLIGTLIGIIGITASFIFLSGSLRYFIIVLCLITSAIPFVINLILKQGVKKEKEDRFLAFSRDLVENVKSGTPISKSIINLRNRNYGTLSPHIQKLANQLSLGIPLSTSLRNFAIETKSRVISRAIGLISEAEKAGGKIETILESVAKSVNQIEDLRKERKSAVSNLVTQGYIIFLVFIIIMLVLEFRILPLVSDLSSSDGLSVQAKNLNPDEFSMPLFVMILVQSFFAGLVIGKISEGSIKDGIKHSFILITLTLVITTGAKALFS